MIGEGDNLESKMTLLPDKTSCGLDIFKNHDKVGKYYFWANFKPHVKMKGKYGLTIGMFVNDLPEDLRIPEGWTRPEVTPPSQGMLFSTTAS